VRFPRLERSLLHGHSHPHSLHCYVYRGCHQGSNGELQTKSSRERWLDQIRIRYHKGHGCERARRLRAIVCQRSGCQFNGGRWYCYHTKLKVAQDSRVSSL
ncbi:hypothetical protein RSAG8_01336, partial [Rhizoctonia solani AG-8 WAC10335]